MKRYCGMCDEWVNGRECPKCGADTDRPERPAFIEKRGTLLIDGWAGRERQPIVVVGETPTRYRVRAPGPGEAVRQPIRGNGGRITYYPGTVLVPKTAVVIDLMDALRRALPIEHTCHGGINPPFPGPCGACADERAAYPPSRDRVIEPQEQNKDEITP